MARDIEKRTGNTNGVDAGNEKNHGWEKAFKQATNAENEPLDTDNTPKGKNHGWAAAMKQAVN